jgi:hypothetical protein
MVERLDSIDDGLLADIQAAQDAVSAMRLIQGLMP